MPGLAGDRKALAIGGGEHATPPGLTQGELMVVIDQAGAGRLEGVLTEEPCRTPDQVICGQVGQVGHLLHAKIAGMGQYTGIEVGQERGSEGLRVGGMDKVAGKVRPGVHLHEEVTQLHARQTLGDACG